MNQLNNIYLGSWGNFEYCTKNPKEFIKIIKNAQDLGISNFDTCQTYGNGEAEKAFNKSLSVSSKIHTKFHINSIKEDLSQKLETSLKRLNRSYLDSFSLLWTPKENFKLESIYKNLLKLKDTELIKKIGFSNINQENLEFFNNSKENFLIQNPFNLIYSHGKKTYQNLNSNHTILCYSPLGQGILSSLSEKKYLDIRKQNRLLNKAVLNSYKKIFLFLEVLSKKYELSFSSICIKWILYLELKVILGVSSNKQLIEILNSLDTQIDNSDYKKLSELSANYAHKLSINDSLWNFHPEINK